AVTLFTLNILLVGAWISWKTEKSFLWAAPAMFIAAFSVDFLRIHSMMWSEPLFLFFVFTSFWGLIDSLERPSRGKIMAAALLASAAWLTRYAGVAVIGSGVLGILLLSENSETRWSHAALYGLIAVGPMGGWLLRNIHLTHHATTRIFTF